MNRNRNILPLIIISQFAGTSLWFAGNAIIPELRESLELNKYAISQVTTAVQFGFVFGTLSFAFIAIADRYSPSRIFFISSLIAALSTVSIIWLAKDVSSLLMLRFITGFFLAGIYPVGMKIAADWYEKGLGNALGWLVGALVLGTAFPHLLKNNDFELPWKTVLICTSAFAVIGGILMLGTGDGPFRKKGARFSTGLVFGVFRNVDFRSATSGYFGHMWELYTFWGFLPLILELYNSINGTSLNIPFLSFVIMGVGAIGCIVGGYLSKSIGSARVAFSALTISGICCLVSPFAINTDPSVFIVFLIIWGIAVVADSPQFSSLVAQTSSPEIRGTALTIATSVGFAITMVSLAVTDLLFHSHNYLSGQRTFMILAIGPIVGLFAMRRLLKKNDQ